MAPPSDQSDRRESRRIAVAIGLLVLVGLGLALFLLSSLGGVVEIFEPGVGLKTAAIIAFATTVVLMIVFAIAAGDSLIGEIQYMLGGFFSFFFILWLLIAWVF